MNTRIKELNEKRGAKLKEASALIAAAIAEKRELTADDQKKISGLHDEAENIAQTIVTESRQLALEGGKIVTSEQEKRDIRRFDYQRLLNHLDRQFRGGVVTPIDGIEAEMLQEGEKEARAAGVQTRGIVLPRVLVRSGVERRDVTATGQTSVAGDQGGMTVATSKAGLLDDFFAASEMRNAGATVIEGLVGNFDVPRLIAGTAAAGKAENANSDEVSPTTLMLSMKPKRLPAYIDISQQLLLQLSSAIEAILRSHLTNQMLETQEKAFFHGAGTVDANGIAGTTGIGSIAGGTNGLAPTYAHLVGLEEKVDAQNALRGSLRYISNGQVRQKLKLTPKQASGVEGNFILSDPRAEYAQRLPGLVHQRGKPRAHEGHRERRLLGDLLRQFRRLLDRLLVRNHAGAHPRQAERHRRPLHARREHVLRRRRGSPEELRGDARCAGGIRPDPWRLRHSPAELLRRGSTQPLHK